MPEGMAHDLLEVPQCAIPVERDGCDRGRRNGHGHLPHVGAPTPSLCPRACVVGILWIVDTVLLRPSSTRIVAWLHRREGWPMSERRIGLIAFDLDGTLVRGDTVCDACARRWGIWSACGASPPSRS